MTNFAKKQAGITFLGLCIVLGVIATYVLFTLSAFTVYNEYLGLQTIMKGVAQLPKEEIKSDRAIMRAFIKRADINNLNRFAEGGIREGKSLVVIEKDQKTGKKTLIVSYKAENKLISNLNLMLDVKEAVPLGEGATDTISLKHQELKAAAKK